MRLATQLRLAFPEFSPLTYGCRNLRQFIRQYVSSVSERGRSGTDVLYSLATNNFVASHIPLPRPKTYLPLPTNPAVWKAYSNPGYPFIVGVNSSNGLLSVFPAGHMFSGIWAEFPKPTTITHKEIAAQFAATKEGPIRSALESLLSDAKWFIQFSPTAKRLGVAEDWIAFRRERLIASFKHSMAQAGVSQSDRPEGTTFSTDNRPFSSAPAVAAPKMELDLRRLVSSLVEGLPDDDLKHLRFSIGSVLEALQKLT